MVSWFFGYLRTLFPIKNDCIPCIVVWLPSPLHCNCELGKHFLKASVNEVIVLERCIFYCFHFRCYFSRKLHLS